MKRFWDFFLTHKNFSYLIIVALVFFGFQSLLSIPRESAPEVIVPVAVVSTPFPGASALDVEKLVTNKIEDHLQNNLEDVNKITSTSQDSMSVVVVEFNATAEIDKSIQDTKDEVDIIKTELPGEAKDPIISEVNFADEPILNISIVSDLPDLELTNLVDQLEDELKSVQGISKVSRSGLPKREVQVVVDKGALSRFGISIIDVSNALSRANSSLPVGSIELDGVSYAVIFEGDIKNPEDIQNVAILGRNGQPVYIRDVATVNNGLSDQNTFSRLSLDNQPSEKSVTLTVFKRSGADVTRISKNVRNKMGELEGTILEDIPYLVSFDSGEYVNDDLSTLSLTALQTVILVMIILLVALGWREAIIAGLSIPLSFLVAFIGLEASGNTINFVSLFSLILSVGILVDSAIVVTEAVHTKMKEGMDKTEAAKETIREFYYPLTSGTTTTIAVFAPLFLLSGVTGQFISSIPFTIIFVLIASLFVALGLVPLIASLFLKRRNRTKIEEKQEEYTHKLQEKYRDLLRKIVGNKKYENRFLKIIIATFFITALFPVFGFVKVIFFPPEDIDFLFVDVERAQGTTLPYTDLSVREVEEALIDMPEVESIVVEVGRTSSFNSAGSSNDSKFGNLTLLLSKDRKRTSSEILDEVRERVSGITSAEVRAFQPSGGPPTGAPVYIEFFGDDLDTIANVVEKSQRILLDIPGTAEINSSIKNDATEFRLVIDRAKASQFGLSAADIAFTLRTAIYGTESTTINNIDGDIDVIVKLGLNDNSQDPHKTTETSIDSILQIAIPTQKGSVLVGSLLDTDLDSSNSTISHKNGKRIGFVSSELEDGYTTRDVVSEFSKRIEQENISNDVEISFGGEAEDVNQSFKEMGLALLLGIIFILAILVLQFNSYRQALFILAIVPFTLIGVFVGLAISGKALSFPSMMGYIALSGIVVNNAIILIDTMNILRKENQYAPIMDIVIDASTRRLRPILLTTLTTVIGIIPLTYSSELWAPLAFAIIFGLSFAVVVTLILVPILYSRWPGKLTKE